MRLKFFAVTIFTLAMAAGGWAQSGDYPQQPPSQDQPPAAQGQSQDYPSQGPSGPGADDQQAQRSEGPAPDVARISLTKGDVTAQRGDTGDWSVTSVNAPVMVGDQVATGDKARTEIQLDGANIVRLAARSQVKIADLSRSRIQLQVSQGYASYSMFNGSEADVEIDTPNVAVHLLRAGRYRVQVTSDAETNVIVREGEAEVTTPQGSTRVKEGDLITIHGTDNPEYRVDSAPAKDDWDQWNRDRDNMIRDSQSVSRTNRNYTGVNDLDSNGRWIYVPGYGNVWQPYQEASWAPYQAGRWVWEPYYGWTWVSYESWGWAPYHYGRWFYYGSSWCWWPGPVYVSYRPIWSPAFVFFVGFGHHSTFGFGSIGWFPVGPHDVFYPWYGRGFN
ncbi:MAG TPA: FecR family protein, partial [Terriglobales bacterium]